MRYIDKELQQKSDFFSKEEEIETIYFGGGTPSLLSAGEIEILLHRVRQNFNVCPKPEITLECNPDDLSEVYLREIYRVGINRLSIGIQTFDDTLLRWMNRGHSNAQSLSCIEAAGKVGFTDLTIDLIYGIPGLTNEKWEETIDMALQVPINHLSAYGLTLEQNTPYAKLVKQKKYEKPSEDSTSEHFEILTKKISQAGWEHYEISNYCKNANYSKHNTAYWQHKKYLGVGPSAHSYNLTSRYWNISSNKEYIDKMENNLPTWEQEELSNADKINEVLLTGLRTKWGVSLKNLKADFGYDVLHTHAEKIAQWKDDSALTLENDTLQLTEKGWLFADYISSQLFVDEDYSSQTSS